MCFYIAEVFRLLVVERLTLWNILQQALECCGGPRPNKKGFINKLLVYWVGTESGKTTINMLFPEKNKCQPFQGNICLEHHKSKWFGKWEASAGWMQQSPYCQTKAPWLDCIMCRGLGSGSFQLFFDILMLYCNAHLKPVLLSFPKPPLDCKPTWFLMLRAALFKGPIYSSFWKTHCSSSVICNSSWIIHIIIKVVME